MAKSPQFDLFEGLGSPGPAKPRPAAAPAPPPARPPPTPSPSPRAGPVGDTPAHLAQPPVLPPLSPTPLSEPQRPSLPPLRQLVANRETRSAGAEVLSVTELTRDLKGLLDDRFSRVAVQGEVSNARKQASSGHVYFRLKDAGAALDAVIFRNQVRLLRFEIRDGLQVVGRGRVTVYERDGRYQLVCDTIEPAGLGALALAFEDLKRRLAAEGLFETTRKRPIPMLPRRIGVVTSPDGAAVRDFLRVLHQRFPSIPVLIAPAKVQGEGAGGEIVEAMKRLVRWSSARPPSEAIDVILLTRGGGSIEDLWAFNEERLARAIATCPIPVVSAELVDRDFPHQRLGPQRGVAVLGAGGGGRGGLRLLAGGDHGLDPPRIDARASGAETPAACPTAACDCSQRGIDR